jgi:hypothetical protein
VHGSCVFGEGRVQRHHRFLALVVDLYGIGAVFRGVGGISQDHSHRFACMADVIPGEQRHLDTDELRAVEHRFQPREAFQIGADDSPLHTGYLQGVFDGHLLYTRRAERRSNESGV